METREQVEASIIGAILMDPDVTEYVMSETNQELFKCYADIYQKIKSMYLKDLKADIVSLVADGIEIHRLTNITASCHTSTYAKTHIHQLKDYDYTERSKAYAENILHAKTIEERMELMGKMPQYENWAMEHKGTVDMVQEALNKIAERSRSNDDCKGIKTGFKRLDKLTGGLMRGGVTVISADTNVGKSLLAERIGLNIAQRGEKVDYFAYEMSNNQCIERMLTMDADIKIESINNPKANWKKQDSVAVQKYGTSLAMDNMNFYADELLAFTFDEFKAKVNKDIMKTGRKPKVIVVDYLELMNGEGDNEVEETKWLFESMMQFSKKLKHTNIIMIMSRNKNGQMSGSNKLRYHAHLNMELNQVDGVDNLLELNVVKNRDGGKGKVQFVFDVKYLKFKEMIEDVQY